MYLTYREAHLIAQFEGCRNLVRALELCISPDDCSHLIANGFLVGCCQWELFDLPEQSVREREACEKPRVSIGSSTGDDG